MKEVLLNVHVEPLTEGGFLATSDDLPGLVAQGRMVAQTLQIAQDVAVGLVESRLGQCDGEKDDGRKAVLLLSRDA